MKQITTLEELDAELEQVDKAASVSDDELRRALASFEFRLAQDCDLDPSSEQYRRRQFEIYAWLSGTPCYDLQNERSHFDIDSAVRLPFPYYTSSAQTVGDQLIATGFIIKTMELPAGSSVLEFGPGWGNTTIALARMGYSVTAVDIEPNFVELINRRAAKLDLPIRTICSNFGIPPGCEGTQFDAVLFFESFHHCGDHEKLIRDLRDLVTEDGVVVFASEPITDHFPLPWGVRCDGMSVWSIRNFKWLELGFQESYFIRTMIGNGWTIEKKVCDATSIGTIFTARRNKGAYALQSFRMPPDEEQSWAPAETDPSSALRFTSGESRITIDGDSRWKICAVDLVNAAPFPINVTIRCGTDRIVEVLAPSQEKTALVPLSPGPRLLEILSPAWSPKSLGINEDARKLGVGVRRVRFLLNPDAPVATAPVSAPELGQIRHNFAENWLRVFRRLGRRALTDVALPIPHARRRTH